MSFVSILVRFLMGICSENEKTYRYSSIAQSVERMTVNHDVTGSSPVRGANRKKTILYAPLAQLVEQLTLNQWVQGSSPWRCTKKMNTAILRCFSFFPQGLEGERCKRTLLNDEFAPRLTERAVRARVAVPGGARSHTPDTPA